MKTLKLAVVACFVGLNSGLVAAPMECYSGSGLMGYNAGVGAMNESLDILWNEVSNADCIQLERFSEAVIIEPTANIGSSQVYLRCRDYGVVEGTGNYVAKLTRQCVRDGVQGGKIIGETDGKKICATLQRNQNTQVACAAIPLFQQSMMNSCKLSLDTYVNNNCPDARFHPSYDRMVKAACKM